MDDSPVGVGRTWLLTALFFLVSLVLVFSISIRRKVDIDEHAFVTSGAIMARGGALPYRDYHYNHMPTQVIVYSLLFRATTYLLLIGRLFQATCAALLCAAIFYVARRSFADFPGRDRWLMPLCAGILILANPFFTRTAGLTWNHDFPTLMIVGAFLVLRWALRAPQSAKTFLLVLFAGMLAGFAVTGRLTFATTLLPLVLFVCLSPGLSLGRRVGILAVSFLGFALACLPSAWIWMQAPADAWFGNFLYPKLNTLYHKSTGEDKAFKLIPIIWYYFKTWITLPGSGIATVTFIIILTTIFDFRQILAKRLHCELFVFALAAICLLVAGCMPAPPYPQYFYSAQPFIILGIIASLSSMPEIMQRPDFRLIAMGLFAVTVGFGLPEYRGVHLYATPSYWTPIRTHDIGQQLAKKTGPGKILTLESIYPMEGGLGFYPELVTSRFILRTAKFLPPDRRIKYKMTEPAELANWFVTRPPAAVVFVLGADERLDGILREDARAAGYVQIPLTGIGTVPMISSVWIPPERATTLSVAKTAAGTKP